MGQNAKCEQKNLIQMLVWLQDLWTCIYFLCPLKFSYCVHCLNHYKLYVGLWCCNTEVVVWYSILTGHIHCAFMFHLFKQLSYWKDMCGCLSMFSYYYWLWLPVKNQCKRFNFVNRYPFENNLPSVSVAHPCSCLDLSLSALSLLWVYCHLVVTVWHCVIFTVRLILFSVCLYACASAAHEWCHEPEQTSPIKQQYLCLSLHQCIWSKREWVVPVNYGCILISVFSLKLQQTQNIIKETRWWKCL